MDRALNSLSSTFRLKVDRGLALLVERGIMVLIVQTSRTPAEAAINLANGTSQTSHSKHLPRRLRGVGFADVDPDINKADAIDLCPYLIYNLHGPDKAQWDRTDPAWKVIGDVGESLDLRWGGRWWTNQAQGLIGFDPGHWEMILNPVDRRMAENERTRPWRV